MICTADYFIPPMHAIVTGDHVPDRRKVQLDDRNSILFGHIFAIAVYFPVAGTRLRIQLICILEISCRIVPP